MVGRVKLDVADAILLAGVESGLLVTLLWLMVNLTRSNYPFGKLLAHIILQLVDRVFC